MNSIRHILLLLFCASFIHISAQTPFNVFGEPDRQEGGVTLHQSPGGAIFLGGYVADSALVQRMDALGNILWSRKFKPAGIYPKRVFDLQTAPDGSLVGCGVGIGPSPAVMHEGFYFRMDMDGNMMWIRSWTESEIYTKRIVPVSATEYLLYNCDYDMGNSSAADIFTARVDAASGNIITTTPRYDLYSPVPYIDDVTNVATIEDSHFMTGRIFTGGSPVSTCRVNVSKFNAQGEHQWTNYLLYSNQANRRMYGSDIIANDDSLMITWTGDVAGSSSNYTVGLISLDTLGNVSWAKSYNVTASTQEIAHKVVKTSFGYVISSHGNVSGIGKIFLIAVSHGGELLWAKQYGTSAQNLTLANSYSPNLIVTPSGLMFTGDLVSSGNRDIVLVGTDNDGNSGCIQISNITVTTSSLPTESFSSVASATPDNYSLEAPIFLGQDVSMSGICDQPTPFDLGSDIISCSPVTLSPDVPNAVYQWQDGSTAPEFVASVSGHYWVQITVDCCSWSDSVQVDIGTGAEIDLGPDQLQCEGGAIELSVEATDLPILWSTDSTGASLQVTTSGSYWVQVGSGECVVSDTVNITFDVPNAGGLSPTSSQVCLEGGSAAISASGIGGLLVPNGYSVSYVLSSGEGLILEQFSSDPFFTINSIGSYTVHTLVYDPQTLDISAFIPGVSTGGDLDAMLIGGGGNACGDLDMEGAMIQVIECNADCMAFGGSLMSDQGTVCLENGSVTLVAEQNYSMVIPDGYTHTYLLTMGEGAVIIDMGIDASFTVSGTGLYSIHGFVYDPATFPIGSIMLGTTTGFELYAMILQGGGIYCAGLDEIGVKFLVEECGLDCMAFGGSLISDQGTVCLENGSVTLVAEQNYSMVIPDGYTHAYLLTMGESAVIIDMGVDASFTVSGTGLYSIHGFVYDPATFPIGSIMLGTTTGFELYAMILQGGGIYCAGLDEIGVKFLVEDCSGENLIDNVWPVPAQEQIVVQLNVPAGANTRMIITSMSGADAMPARSIPAGAKQVILNVASLESGQYLIRLIGLNGTSTYKFSKIN